MRSKRIGTNLVCVAATLMALTSVELVATAQQDPGATTTLEVYSRLTVVDVTATDAKGRPINGLLQSDFIIFEDGQAAADPQL